MRLDVLNIFQSFHSMISPALQEALLYLLGYPERGRLVLYSLYKVVIKKTFAMNYFLLAIFTLCVVQQSSTQAATRTKLSYEDLKILNASCHPRDSCAEARVSGSPGISDTYSCSCDALCSKFGTCCIDAPSRNDLVPTVRPQCRSVEDTSNSRGFYMVDKCGKFNPIWERVCEEEWRGEDNIMKIAPVTSLFSSLTYKNYFCFRCHERTHDYLFWNVELLGDESTSGEDGDFGVVYDNEQETWMAIGENGTSIPVTLRFTVPNTIGSLAVQCETDMISNCSDRWTDQNVREKCGAYTAIVYIKRDNEVLKYKNVHCAICSFESKEDMVCEYHETLLDARRKIFSFRHLIDINASDGNRVGKARKCEENFVWDPYGEKCRKLTCAIPGYVIKEGKCAPRL